MVFVRVGDGTILALHLLSYGIHCRGFLAGKGWSAWSAWNKGSARTNGMNRVSTTEYLLVIFVVHSRLTASSDTLIYALCNN